MTFDVRHDIGQQERVALAVLGFGSLFSLGIGYAILLYQNKTVGYIVISFSGLLLLIVLIVNSLQQSYPRTYNRIVLLLNPNVALREVRPTRPAIDCPPSYKESWARAFKQRTITSPSSTTTAAEGPLPPPVDVDLERHLVGRVGRKEGENGRSERRMFRGKRSQKICVQKVVKSDQELHEEEGEEPSPPPFETAILKLSAEELEKINENLPHSKLTSINDTVVVGVGSPDVFSVEHEFCRGQTETTEIFPSRKTQLEVAQVHSPQLSSEIPPASQVGSIPQDDQSSRGVMLSSETPPASQVSSIPQDDQSSRGVIVSNGRSTASTAERGSGRVQA